MTRRELLRHIGIIGAVPFLPRIQFIPWSDFWNKVYSVKDYSKDEPLIWTQGFVCDGPYKGEFAYLAVTWEEYGNHQWRIVEEYWGVWVVKDGVYRRDKLKDTRLILMHLCVDSPTPKYLAEYIRSTEIITV